ncbi:MAG: outer membrane beta-barrel protein [Ignavibacteriae bacterium]|nr:outer membrane beta-barrel protein [Ignavibacteriota bacterium]
MKRALLAVMFVVALASHANAAGPISFGLHLNGASINVDGPLKDAYNIGYGGGVHLDIGVIPIVDVRINGDYITFSLDDTKTKNYVASVNPGTVAGSFGLDGGRINILSIGVNGKVGLPTPLLSPYATGGLGMARISFTDLTVSYPGFQPATFPGGGSQTKFSANLGAGADLKLAIITIYLELKYTWIFTDGATSTYVPVTLGVTF